MKLFSKLTLALFCAMLLASISDAQAQKKSKGLAKQIIGTWSLADFDMTIDESKADEAAKQEFANAKAFMGVLKEQMKDKVVFTFNADGTYSNTTDEDGNPKTEQGTWKLDGNKLMLKPETPDEDMPPFFLASIANNFLTMEAPAKQDSPMSMSMKFAKK